MASQNVTNPELGLRGLDLLAGGAPAAEVLATLLASVMIVALIFIYAKLMGKIDEKFDVHEE